MALMFKQIELTCSGCGLELVLGLRLGLLLVSSLVVVLHELGVIELGLFEKLNLLDED